MKPCKTVHPAISNVFVHVQPGSEQPPRSTAPSSTCTALRDAVRRVYGAAHTARRRALKLNIFIFSKRHADIPGVCTVLSAVQYLIFGFYIEKHTI